jgi:hypothetical protein
MATRSEIAREVIGQVHRSLPENATIKERKAALKAAYPFGTREYWPYKAWCKAQREYLAKFTNTASQRAQREAWRKKIEDSGFTFFGEGA